MAVKIEFIDHSWTCGDGCCDDYWVTVLVNGEPVGDKYPTGFDALEDILKALGHTDIEIEERPEGDA